MGHLAHERSGPGQGMGQLLGGIPGPPGGLLSTYSPFTLVLQWPWMKTGNEL